MSLADDARKRCVIDTNARQVTNHDPLTLRTQTDCSANSSVATHELGGRALADGEWLGE